MAGRTGAAPSARTTRLFFALWPDRAAGDALSALAHVVASQARGRAGAAENLHVTLAFLGEIADERVATLRELGAEVAAASTAFVLTLDRIGSFRGAGIAWAGAAATPPGLDRLVQCLNAALAQRGFPTERRTFHPHVTLARRCVSAVDAMVPTPIAWNVERITLNASQTLAGGPRYRAVADWVLGTPDATASATAT